MNSMLWCSDGPPGGYARGGRMTQLYGRLETVLECAFRREEMDGRVPLEGMYVRGNVLSGEESKQQGGASHALLDTVSSV
jgi:hypothetical protein